MRLVRCVGLYYVKLEAQKLFESFSDEEIFHLHQESKFEAKQGNDGIMDIVDIVNNQENDCLQ